MMMRRRANKNNSSNSNDDVDASVVVDSSIREVETLLKQNAAATVMSIDSPNNHNNHLPNSSSFDQLRSSLSVSPQHASGWSSSSFSRRESIPRPTVLFGNDNNNNTAENHHSIRPLEDFTLAYHAMIIARQSQRLIAFLVHGTPIWVIKLVRLQMFVVALIPAFIVAFFFYFFTSDRISLPYITTTTASSTSTNNDDDDDNDDKKDLKRTSRHYLDIYGSTTATTTTTTTATTLKPVLIFVTGGAWIIGYKAWGALLARVLAAFGVLVVIPDYRNFPQTNVRGMIRDVDYAIEWTIQNIAQYGGDPTKIVIAAQSAGAHLTACLLLKKALLEAPTTSTSTSTSSSSSDEGGSAATATATTDNTTSWHALDIKGYIAISGPYDLVAMRGLLHNHGLDKNITDMLFCNDVARYSPTRMLRDMLVDNDDNNNKRHLMQQHFPPTCIIHGQVDKTVPFQISVDFYEALKQLQQQQPPQKGSSQSQEQQPQEQQQQQQYLEFKLYPSWSHTDLILEAPFAGNHLFHRDIYDLVKLWTTSTEEEEKDDSGNCDEGDDSLLLLPFDESNPVCRKICPLFLVHLARFCNPF